MDAVILWLQQNVTTQLAVVLIRTGSKQQSQLHKSREGGEMGNPSFIKQAYSGCDAAGLPNLCYGETKQLTQCNCVLVEQIPSLL
jgi:hypothetical protein